MRLVCGTCSAVQYAADEVEPRCAACNAPLIVTAPAGGTGRAGLRSHVGGRSAASVLPRELWFVRTGEGDSQTGPFGAGELSRGLEQGAFSWSTEVWREGLSSWRAARRDELLVLAIAGVRGLDGATRKLDSVQELLVSQHEKRPALRVVSQRDLPTGRPPRDSLPVRTRPHGTRSHTGWIALVAFVVGALVAWKPAPRIEQEVSTLPPDLPSQERRPGVAQPRELGTAQAESPRRTEQREAGPSELAQPATQPSTSSTLAVEVRAELVRRAPRVRDCLLHPRRGLTLSLHVLGASGSLAQLEVLAPSLTPGARECVHDALADLHVAPFDAPRYAMRHVYRW